MVNVEFTNGTNTFNKEFQFSINATLDEMKRTVKDYLRELNFVPPDITDFEYTEPTPVTPTTAELARQAWETDREKLRKLMELVRDGVFTGTETQIVNLKAKVKADFKPAYLD